MSERAVWFPSDPSNTNVGRFQTKHALPTFDALVRRSIDEPEWFWDAVVEHLGFPFSTPYTNVLDTNQGIEWATWFVDGKLNLADVLLRHEANRAAIVWEGEDGDVRRLTYGELAAEVDRVARMLASSGIGTGDAVGIFMPMLPQTVAALVAVMKLGAVFLPLFSGYGAEAIATRLRDADAKALITTDFTFRRGKKVDMQGVAEQAAGSSPTVNQVLVLERTPARSNAGDTPRGSRSRSVQVDSEHTLFIAYTSGTTGKPKGSVAVHAGFGVKVAEEVAFQFDCGRDDTLFWFTDMGWIMGPWEVVGALGNGATLALYEGAPDWPEPDRLWSYVENHRVTILGISPTLVRTLMPHGNAPVERHDLSSLRILGSTGEPWNEAPWHWYFEVVGARRCPVINISGGTEVGACFLSPHPVEPLKPMSLGGPSLGMAVDVFDDNGRPVRGQVGELVCTKPWPGMTRGLFRDRGRYIETYWSTFPGVWRHGDWASIDDDGDWFLHGRSDDTIKIAGKRLGPAEVESVLVSHPSVVEAAAIGMPDPVKGESLWAFVVLADGAEWNDEVRAQLIDSVAQHLGKSFRPSAVKRTRALPKTRNAKVLRRAIRATALAEDPGDLSALEDPSSIDAIKAAS